MVNSLGNPEPEPPQALVGIDESRATDRPASPLADAYILQLVAVIDAWWPPSQRQGSSFSKSTIRDIIMQHDPVAGERYVEATAVHMGYP